ncbi:hypothetical protein [Occultella gossypii]|uniref:PQQ-binding-like beta-propeller repeat protein n=1 Tax=Occultella gossypii TaxID=2800820 RepID=A0ABS7SGG6_9MICO|nr:hypothetical protein [Occultella gossypii]MBZ2199455.1 hypothetical protein [Occultella gossypii]
MGRGGAEEFVLDFDEPDSDQAGDPEAVPPPRRRRDGPDLPRPAALWSGVAVLLVVTGILVAPPPPGPSWGVSPGWSSAPVRQWTVPLAGPADDLTWMTVEDDQVLIGGADRLDAYDRADGSHRWSVVDVARCALADSMVVCVAGTGAEATVSVVDSGGAVREVALPGTVAATLNGGDLVVLAEDAAGDYVLTVHVGIDPDQVRWTTSVAARRDVFGDTPPSVRSWDDLVLVGTGDLYRARSGEQIPGSWSWLWLDDKPLVNWRDDQAQAILPGTAEVVGLPGLGVPAMIDDGSPPSVTIVQSEDFTTMEARTADGEVLWDAPLGWALVRLGDAILMSDSETRARDVRTGEWLWSFPGFVTCPCRGDASGLLLFSYEFDQASESGGLTDVRLLGLRIADGEVLWEVPLADDALVADADNAFAVLADEQLTLYSRT